MINDFYSSIYFSSTQLQLCKKTNKPKKKNDQRNMTAQLYCIIKPNSAQLQNKSSCLQPVAVNTDNAAPVIFQI